MRGKTIKDYGFYNDGNGLVIYFTDGTEKRFYATTNGEFEVIEEVKVD